MRVFNVKLTDVVKTVYDLSSPQGMGYLHYQPGPLPDDVAEKLVASCRGKYLSLDYVSGRACKFFAEIVPGGIMIEDDRWFDHSLADLNELFKRLEVLEQK